MTFGLSGSQGPRRDVSGMEKTPLRETSAAENVRSTLRDDTLLRADATQHYTPPDIEPSPDLPQLQPPTIYQKPATELPNPATAQEIYDAKLADLLRRLNLKNTSIADRVRFAIDHPEVTLKDEFVVGRELAKRLQEEIAEYARNLSGDKDFAPQPPNSAKADQALSLKRNALFESLIREDKSLSEAEKNSLLLAYYRPDGTQSAGLTPKQLELLKKYDQATQKLFDKTGLAPEGYELKPNADEFNGKTSFALAEAFEQLAGKMSPPLTPKEYNYLRFKFYHSEGPNPPLPPGKTKEQMDALFGKNFSQAQANFTKQSQFPAGFTPAVSSEVYDAILLGRFEDAFERQIAGHSPPLTEEQKAMLRAALGQKPEDIPALIKALFEKFNTTAMAEIIEMYDLPPNWQLKKRDLNNPLVKKQKAKVETELNAAKAAEEMIGVLAATAEEMPPGPARVQSQSYTRIIAEALSKYTESLFASSSVDAEAASKMSQANYAARMDQMKIEKKRADEAKAKEKKAAKMQTVLGIFGSIFMGPIGVALAVQKAVTGKNWFESFEKIIFKAIDKTDSSDAGKAILNILARIYLTGISTTLGGPMMMMQTLTDSLGDSIADFLELTGVKKDKAEFIGMITAMSIVLVGEIAASIFTAGAFSGAMVGSFSHIANMIRGISKPILEALSTTMRTVNSVFRELPELTAKATQITQNVTQRVIASEARIQSLLTKAQEAAQLAQRTPNAANIAKANSRIQKLAREMEELVNATNRLTQRLEREALASKNINLSRASRAVKAEADTLQKALSDVQKMAESVEKASQSGTRTGQLAEERFKKALKFFSYGSAAMTGATTGVNVGREILLGQATVITGEKDAFVKKIRALTKLIQMTIDMMMNEMTTTTEAIKRVQQVGTNLFNPSHFVA